MRSQRRVDEVLTQRREIYHAELPVEQLHRAVKVTSRRVLAGDRALLRPSPRDRDTRGGSDEHLADDVAPVGIPAPRAEIRGELQILHVPSSVGPVVLAVALALLVVAQAEPRERVLLLLLLLAAEVEVEVVAPSSAGVVVFIHDVIARRDVARQHTLEEALGDGEQRPVVLLGDGLGRGHEHAGAVNLRDDAPGFGQDGLQSSRVLSHAVGLGGEVREGVLAGLL